MLRAARPTAALGLSLWRAAMCSRAAGNSSDAAGDRQLAAAPGSPAAASERAAAPPAAPKPKRLRTLPGAPASGMQPAGRGGSGSSRPDYKEPGPGLTQLPGGGVLQLQTDLLAPAVAAALFEQLRRELPWEQRNVRVMGRQVAQPRLIAYQADGPELQYTYSGATLAPAAWHPAVLALKQRVEASAGTEFNCCLLNLYRSGADSIAWHSDSEPLFGRQPTIASVSLGAPREFLLRRNADPSDKYRLRLGGGALLVMRGPVQEQWQHSVPRRQGLQGERISLTFRRIMLPERPGGGGGRGGT